MTLESTTARPLSFAQERLWFLEQLDSMGPAYNMPAGFRVRGPLDVDALCRSLTALVDRHESLRTRFEARDGIPHQIVAAAPALFPLLVVDLTTITPALREADVVRRVRAEAALPFELAHGAAFRASLLRLAADDHVLLLTLHHIVADAWSLGILAGDLSAFYSTDVAGGRAALPPLPVQYVDYAAWQRERMTDAALARQLEYWAARLATVTPLALPADRRPPAAPPFRGAACQFTVPQSIVDGLTVLGRQQGATLFMVLLAALDVVLARWSGQTDIVVGSPIAGRTQPELEALIGCFVNTLALRVDLAGDPEFRAVLTQVKDRTLEAYAHQDVPFEKLVAELQPSRDIANQPLFRVVLSLDNVPDATLMIPGLTFTPIRGEHVTTKFDLTLAFHGSEGGLEGAIEYSTDLFDAESIRGFADRYLRVLEVVIHAPQRRLSAIDLLGAPDRQTLLALGNPASAKCAESCVHELAAAQTALAPDAIAVVHGDDAISYTCLNTRANAIAGRLRGLGVGPESTVVIYLERGIDLPVALLAVLKVGGAYVPVDLSFPAERVAAIFEATVPHAVVTHACFRDRLPPGNARVYCLDTEVADPPVRASPVSRPCSPDNLAYIMYTSGSTGAPKGIAIPHRAIVRLVLQTDYVALDSTDVVAHLSNPAFDAATFEIWGALLNGGRIACIDRAVAVDPVSLADAMREAQVTTTFLTTTLFDRLAAARPALPSMRQLLVGGEAVKPNAARSILPSLTTARLLNVYGPTETTTFATWHHVESVPEEPLSSVPIGRPIANTSVYVLDAFGALASIECPGELHIGGPGLARGYVGQPALTAESFLPDAFGAAPGQRLYRTGDRVRWRSASIEFMGRLDDQVKLRGYRIEPAEIEAEISRCPGVRQAIVVKKSGENGEKLVAYLVLAAGAQLDTTSLRAALHRRLPQFMVPQSFATLETLPLTSTGKIDRQSLATRTDPDAPSDGDRAPRHATEHLVAQVWGEVLGRTGIGVHETFFDAGGHSLLLPQVLSRLRARCDATVTMLDLFRYPTIEALGRYLRAGSEAHRAPSHQARAHDQPSNPIAVIGMSGRFPGASDLAAYWENLRSGKESLRRLTDEELAAEGVDEELRRHPAYVPVKGTLDNVDALDARFFGLTPREAEITDPQQRLFMECGWLAMEDAGYDAWQCQGAIGLYAGVSRGTYGRDRMHHEAVAAVGAFQALIGNETDYVATRTSYKLNLRGPSMTVQTACSASLVAVHLACQSLLAGESELALAGGVRVTHDTGYLFEEGGILSPDGHCRTFDADAQGTLPGDGVGVVVLKRLADAERDGDRVLAVVRASAINNDGAVKVGYTATSLQGETAVIRTAHQRAGVRAQTIGYVEVHGTATAMGDPIEIEALSQAFQADDALPYGHCVIGGVKTNIGHLDAAAGIAGFIKTVLMLQHGVIPPSLHFQRANTQSTLERSPFRVSRLPEPWRRGEHPRRAGVSAFGIGGTNAHVVLEEAPPPAAVDPEPDEPHLLVISARTETALRARREKLARHLARGPSCRLADVAFTLQVGRRRMPWRTAIVCRSVREAIAALNGKRVVPESGGCDETEEREVVFLFGGQGSQRLRMGCGLYRRERVYTSALDECAQLIRDIAGWDLRKVLARATEDELQQTAIAQPALYAVQYALARLWASWGVRPAALLGHSVGEYVAAALAGVFTWEDGLRLVVERGRLLQSTTPGAMLAVTIAEPQVREWPDVAKGTVDVAAINGPDLTVLAGPTERIDLLHRDCVSRGLFARRLRTSHAFHSSMVEGVLERWGEFVARVPLRNPETRLVTNVTGTWAEPGELSTTAYWIRQMRGAVRFADGLRTILLSGPRALLEVGAGDTMGQLARIQPDWANHPTMASLPRDASTDEPLFLRRAAGRLWGSGVTLDWRGVHGTPRRRVALPLYPFERARHWLDRVSAPSERSAPRVSVRAKDQVAQFMVPSWERAAPLLPPYESPAAQWVVCGNDDPLTSGIVQHLRDAGHRATLVRQGHEYRAIDADTYELNPRRAEEIDRFVSTLARDRLPDRILHLWTVGPPQRGDPIPFHSRLRSLTRVQTSGVCALLFLTQAFARHAASHAVEFVIVSNGMYEVSGTERLIPERNLLAGFVRVIPQEHPQISCRIVDLDTADVSDSSDGQACRTELLHGHARAEPVVAWRGAHGWIQRWVPLRAGAAPDPGDGVLRTRGVYLLTGGWGRIGLVLAEHLVQRVGARLVLVGRSVPGAAQRARLDELTRGGGEVLIRQADVGDLDRMRDVFREAKERFGAVHGVVHAAVSRRDFRLLAEMTVEDVTAQIRPKVVGAMVLDEILASEPVDFCVGMSSIASILGGFGFGAYAAANAYVDALAQARRGQPGVLPWRSVSWDGWRFEDEPPLGEARSEDATLSLTPSEGLEAMRRVLAVAAPHVVVSTRNLQERLERWVRMPGGEQTPGDRLHLQTISVDPETRPSTYSPPRTQGERLVAACYEELLGVRPVGVNDDFFALGGHSLLALQLMRRLQGAAKTALTIRCIYEHPTPAALAAHIEPAMPRTA